MIRGTSRTSVDFPRRERNFNRDHLGGQHILRHAEFELLSDEFSVRCGESAHMQPESIKRPDRFRRIRNHRLHGKYNSSVNDRSE